MVFALARETGWSRDFILWELAFDELLQYYHCMLRANGVWTVKQIEPASAQFARLSAAAMIDEEEEE